MNPSIYQTLPGRCYRQGSTLHTWWAALRSLICLFTLSWIFSILCWEAPWATLDFFSFILSSCGGQSPCETSRGTGQPCGIWARGGTWSPGLLYLFLFTGHPTVLRWNWYQTDIWVMLGWQRPQNLSSWPQQGPLMIHMQRLSVRELYSSWSLRDAGWSQSHGLPVPTSTEERKALL